MKNPVWIHSLKNYPDRMSLGFKFAHHLEQDIQKALPDLPVIACQQVVADWINEKIDKAQCDARILVATKLKVVLKLALNNVDADISQGLALKWAQSEVSVHNLEKMAKSIQMMPLNDSKIFKELVAGGAEPAHLAVFALSENRSQFVKTWMHKGTFFQHLAEGGKRFNTLASIVLMSGLTSVCLTSALGSGLENQDILQTAQQLGGYLPKVDEVYKKIVGANVGLWTVGLWSAYFSGKVIHHVASSAVKAPDSSEVLRDLEDRVDGAFRRNPKDLEKLSKSQLLLRLNGLSNYNRHLLTHLEPVSLALYLKADEEGRYCVLRNQPPSLDQRMNAASCEEKKIWGRFKTRLNESLLTFNGPSIIRSPTARPKLQ